MGECLALKYRPKKLSDLIGQNNIIDQIEGFFKSNHIPQAYIFSGPRGTGKTSLARIFAKRVNCINPERANPCCVCVNCKDIDSGVYSDYVEMDGASNTGVDDVRKIIEAVAYKSLSGKAKVYIIDECHMLSKSAWNSLLKTIEEPPLNTYFILVTTENGKIPETIKSRSHTLFFRAVKYPDIIEHLNNINSKENNINNSVISIIANHAQGSVRDAVMLYEKITVLPREVIKNESEVSKYLGVESIEFVVGLVGAAWNKQYSVIIENAEIAVSYGYDFIRLTRSIQNYISDTIIFASTKNKQLCDIFGDYMHPIENNSSVSYETVIKQLVSVFFKLVKLEQNLNYRNDKDIFITGLIEAFS